MSPHRFILRAAVAWCLASGSLSAQEDSEPHEDTAPQPRAEPVPTAVLRLKDGGFAEGPVVLRGETVVVTSGGAAPVSARIGDIAQLEVRLPEKAANDPDPGTLLAGALPAPWRSRDLGRLVIPGRARWKDHQFIISGSAQAEGENFDAMHMVYHPMTGDGEIVARVVKIDNEDEASFGGIIMCDGLTPENRKAMLAVHLHGERRVNFRRWGYAGGSSTGREDPAIKAPFWLKLVREDYDVKAYYSPDGRRWRFLKESPGKMRDEEIYVGLVARLQEHDQLSDVVIDNVSINGIGSKPAVPMLPHVVLRSGSRLAADLVKGDATAFRFRGRWKDLAITAPQVARVEFFHPLPEDLEKLVQGERTGLLLRSGDFSEGSFQSLGEGKIVIGSVLFGENTYSILDQADALVLRREVEPADPPAVRLETHAGSILLAQKAALTGDQLVLEVAGLGEVRFGLAEIAALERLPAE